MALLEFTLSFETSEIPVASLLTVRTKRFSNVPASEENEYSLFKISVVIPVAVSVRVILPSNDFAFSLIPYQ